MNTINFFWYWSSGWRLRLVYSRSFRVLILCTILTKNFMCIDLFGSNIVTLFFLKSLTEYCKPCVFFLKSRSNIATLFFLKSWLAFYFKIFAFDNWEEFSWWSAVTESCSGTANCNIKLFLLIFHTSFLSFVSFDKLGQLHGRAFFNLVAF